MGSPSTGLWTPVSASVQDLRYDGPGVRVHLLHTVKVALMINNRIGFRPVACDSSRLQRSQLAYTLHGSKPHDRALLTC